MPLITIRMWCGVITSSPMVVRIAKSVIYLLAYIKTVFYLLFSYSKVLCYQTTNNASILNVFVVSVLVLQKPSCAVLKNIGFLLKNKVYIQITYEVTSKSKTS